VTFAAAHFAQPLLWRAMRSNTGLYQRTDLANEAEQESCCHRSRTGWDGRTEIRWTICGQSGSRAR
jgi:hypothetical protein